MAAPSDVTGRRLSGDDSAAIFGRTGDVTQVRVTLG